MTRNQRFNLVAGLLALPLANVLAQDSVGQIVIALLFTWGTVIAVGRPLPIEADDHLPVWADFLLGTACVLVLLAHGAYEVAVCATAATIADCTFR